jgi:hypothetical protein
VPRGRFDYNTAISASWKDQTLLNIVKIRYADFSLFVEVASIVSGYSMESLLIKIAVPQNRKIVLCLFSIVTTGSGLMIATLNQNVLFRF